jgi:AcrR family transcriptional regulator
MAAPLPSSPPPPLHWVKPPQQVRSQKTLERVLDATEEVLAERGVLELTVSEVVKRAESSVGAFYARFPDKDALLAIVHERSCGEAFATAELALNPSRWRSSEFASALTELVAFTARLCRERRGLMRAFITMAATNEAAAARRADLVTKLAGLLHAFLLTREDEIAHPNPKVAAEVAIRMIFGTLEHGSLFKEAEPREAPLLESTLSSELARAVLSYLGAPTSVGRRAASIR